MPRFSVQEHHASHLHWDLRLEKDGVLKSWAIPKGPPLEPGVRRLAIQTEDHPLDYIYFEGIIPPGYYGAGVVKLWDKGEYDIEKWEDEKIVVNFHGEKLKGRYTLLRLRDKNWLIFKNKRQD
ncbi:DNA ligase D, 3'-phosphoesterase domain protein [Thermodesulfatator indicus DSM 15286]|uniref:DNA ligase D, 3'-phosphoesterase domain protein n=1 Tax=Thermodesulfatator indicus (strain DSM 15286 / JCM 11887 / CIR29812) TaxID=667014 RepID=F8A9V5_THEID|nr:DNA polymerase ligase N-terminal domain-containing protein [Thermodesulfatator indicus]AEH44153.1 DNA ligase D, 3'-phosphoesterase domain protein [Thermodesulfatator indicus DSM 15286]